jgi:hypothetical protein
MGVNNGDKEMIVPDWSAVGAAGKVGGNAINVDGNADYGFLEYVAKDEHNAQFEEHLKDVRDETFFVLQRFALGNYTSLYWTDTSWMMRASLALMKVYERKMLQHVSRAREVSHKSQTEVLVVRGALAAAAAAAAARTRACAGAQVDLARVGAFAAPHGDGAADPAA